MYHQLEELGCDLNSSLVLNNKQSASFMAIIDEYQNVLSAISDSDIVKYLSYDYIKNKEEIIEQAEYILFDSNEYKLFDQFLKEYTDVKLIVDPVSSYKSGQIKRLLPHLHTKFAIPRCYHYY